MKKKILVVLSLGLGMLFSSANADFTLTNVQNWNDVKVILSTDTPINANTVATQFWYDVSSLDATNLQNLTWLDTITLESNDSGITMISGWDTSTTINGQLFSFDLSRKDWITDTDFLVALTQGSYIDENANENAIVASTNYVSFSNGVESNTQTYSSEATINEKQPVAMGETNVKTWKENILFLLLSIIIMSSLFLHKRKA